MTLKLRHYPPGLEHHDERGTMDTLPKYRATRSKDFPAFLIVWCPYDNCPSVRDERPFLVAERTWLRPNRLERTSPTGKPILITGRSCPYCFRTARLPRRNEIR